MDDNEKMLVIHGVFEVLEDSGMSVKEVMEYIIENTEYVAEERGLNTGEID